jgi:hypothetical protein
MTAAELNPDMRTLIDARLDAIDLVLIRAQMAWSERRNIVGEVETQIFELLARKSPAPTREDVQAVLDSLDPPEAWIPEALREQLAGAAGAAPPRTSWLRANWPRVLKRELQRAVKWGLVLAALVAVNAIVVTTIAATNGLIPWLVTLGVLAWLNYVAVRRLRAWMAAHPSGFLDHLRHSLAGWLLPKNSAAAT